MNNFYKRTSKILILAKIIENEYMMDFDNSETSKEIKALYKRIGKASSIIQDRIKKHQKYTITEVDKDTTLDASVYISGILDSVLELQPAAMEALDLQMKSEIELLKKEAENRPNKEKRNEIIDKIFNLDLDKMEELNTFVETLK